MTPTAKAMAVPFALASNMVRIAGTTLSAKAGITLDACDTQPPSAKLATESKHIMSPNVGNFVHDLVEMAKAMETLPQVQADLSDARSEIDRLQTQVQRLELRLIDRANEIDGLNTKVREAEKARDDAETMFLETDERLSAFRHLVSGFSSNAASLLRAQEPIVEQPPQAVPSSDDGVQGQSEAGPTTSTASTTTEQSSGNTTQQSDVGSVSSSTTEVSVPTDPTQATESSSGSGSNGSVQPEEWAAKPLDPELSVAMQTGGQSAADPTAPSWAGNTPLPASAPTDAAATVADASASAGHSPEPGPAIGQWEPEPTPLPYAGLKWSMVTPRVYNYGDWERGGGTAENFNL